MNDTAAGQVAADAADKNGMCTVEAMIDGVTDNGHRYPAGKVFHMHKDLVPSHVAAGQVRLAEGGKKQQPEPATKQQPTLSDKQAVPAADKQFTGAKDK